MSRIKICCPSCGARIFDSEEGIQIQTRKIEKNSIYRNWQPQYYIKCYKCKSEIGCINN